MLLPNRWAALICAFLFLVAGCVARSHLPYDPRSAIPPDRNALDANPLFDYAKGPVVPDNSVLDDEETDQHRVRHLKFTPVGESGQPGNAIAAHYYESKSLGKKRLIIVLPIWGSYIYPSETMSLGLMEHGEGDTNVLHILGEKHIWDWAGMRDETDQRDFIAMLHDMAERTRTALIDLRRILDWAQSRPEIDSERIGMLGFSHGAMYTAMIAILEPRLASTVLIMGAAQPHEVVARCPALWARQVQETVTKRFGWTLGYYALQLKPIFQDYDPANYPRRVDPERVLMIDARYDECVPADTREALWKAMGRPERITIFESHGGAFLSMTPLGFNWLRDEVYAFFDRTL